MSVTITIRNNAAFCRQYANLKPELVRVEKWPCHCDMTGEAPARDCPDCGGSGEIESLEFAFEMNLANGNFATLWSALGYNADPSGGELPAHEVGLAIEALQDGILERAERHQPAGTGPAIVHCGIRAEQAQSYIQRLSAICEEACLRGEPIVWG